MIDAAGDDGISFETAASLFSAMLNARAACPPIEDDVNATLAKVAASRKLTLQGLYDAHILGLLEQLHSSHTDWTKHSHERRVFDVLLLRAGGAIGNHVTMIMDILYCNFQLDKDPEIRLSFFALLSKLLGNPQETLNSAAGFNFAERVMKEIVIPNCVWQNGRVPAALRTAASTCLWALLQSGLVTGADVDGSISAVLPQLVSLLDDPYEETRLVICRVVEQLLRVYPQTFNHNYESYDRLHSLYPELLKRMDDNSDEIRLVSLGTWLAFAKCVSGKEYDVQLYRSHMEACVKGLMIHLDDGIAQIQGATGLVLQEFAVTVPQLVAAQARMAKAKHRDAEQCAALEAHAEAIVKKL